MKKNRLFFIIEARVTSKRLPGKVLKKIFRDYLSIDYVIKNIINAGINKENIILATPTSNKNTKLWSHVEKKYKIKIFKGSEENVFKRIFDCCKKYNIKSFARITSDNIMLDPILIKKVVKQFKKNNIEYIASNTLEHSISWKENSDYNEGSSIEILKADLLKKIKHLVNKNNCEYPTWLIFSKPNKFKLQKIKLIKEYRKSNIKNYRTTLDTLEDLQFLRAVSKKLNLVPGQNNLLKILKNQNKIKLYTKINKNIKKKLAYKIVGKNKR